MIFGSLVGQILTRTMEVGEEPTMIAVNPDIPAKGRTTIEVYVPYSKDVSAVYIGGVNVATTSGIPIPILTSKIIPVNRDAALFLVADMPTQVVIAEYIS